MPINFLTGDRSLRRQRDKSIDFAESMYGGRARALEPIRNLGSEMASEGVGEQARSIFRQRAITEFTAPRDLNVFGGNAARAVSGSQRMDAMSRQGMAAAESELQIEDMRTRQVGREQFAEAESGIRENLATRDAAIDQTKANYQAERSARRQQLLGTAIGLAASGALSPIAGKIGSAAGGLLGRMGTGSAIPPMNATGETPSILQDTNIESTLDYTRMDLVQSPNVAPTIQEQQTSAPSPALPVPSPLLGQTPQSTPSPLLEPSTSVSQPTTSLSQGNVPDLRNMRTTDISRLARSGEIDLEDPRVAEQLNPNTLRALQSNTSSFTSLRNYFRNFGNVPEDFRPVGPGAR